jgi:hypothetical protein
MKRRTRGLFNLLGFIAFLICLLIVRPAWQARRPSDMPHNSIWIEAPAVPLGFYRGWWLGCWIDSDHISNRCRFWSSGGLGVVYEGRSIFTGLRIPESACWTGPYSSSEMHLTPHRTLDWLWTSLTGMTAVRVFVGLMIRPGEFEDGGYPWYRLNKSPILSW